MDGHLSNALSRFVLEHHREAVVVLDRAGGVLESNRSACGAELDLTALFGAPERDARVRAFLEELTASRRAFTLVASPLGTVFRLEGTAIDDVFVVVAHEISRDAGGTSVVGPVAASFIHDFNNLLMPILLFAGRLRRDLEEGSQAAMLAAEMHASASVAAALARDLLALSRPRAPVVERLDVNELVRSNERLVRRLAGGGVDVLFALGDGEPLESRVDGKALAHALLTLVSHARDRMPEGGQLAISTAFVDRDGARKIALALTDTGADVDGAPRPMEIDGFRVSYESTLQRGTNVTVFLDPATPSLPVASDATAGQLVMLAERDERLRRAIEGVLRDRGFEVVSVGARGDAVEAAAVHPLRVALIDTSFLRRSPSAFLQELRSHAPSLRFVLLADQTFADAAGSSVVVLTKPFGDEELVRAVRDALV